jgi:hypothetical protein
VREHCGLVLLAQKVQRQKAVQAVLLARKASLQA